MIAIRKPANRIGWILTGIGFAFGLGVFLSGLVRYLYFSPWGHDVAGWIALPGSPLSISGYGLLAFLLLTFPDGRLHSRRWRWLAGAVVAFLVLIWVDQMVRPGSPLPGLPPSPLANPALARLLDPLSSDYLFLLMYLAAGSSLIFRYRAGNSAVRQQIKWFAFGVVVLIACNVTRGVVYQLATLEHTQLGAAWSAVGTGVQSVGLIAIPTSIGVAVIRRRLFDIDLVISRAIAYGALAGLTTGLYVGLVVGAGALIGRTATTNLLLSIVATALVAVAFQPLRLRLLAAANRLVYGQRQAPYESLAGFTRRLASDYSVDAVLPRMAEAVAQGLRCRAAAVMVGDGPTARVAGGWPDAFQLPHGPPDKRVEVLHQGEKHGSLAVWTRTGEELNVSEQRLLSDLAVQAGLILHNARLTIELERRLEELRASRLRLVTAQDQERRRLERDLHDGAQHDLVAVRMKLGLAEGVASSSGSHLAALLSELREDTAATLENIRRLSRGLYPPLLESQGLGAALTAHARRLLIPVEVWACELRFPREVETAVYFCCVEALQNAAKHASAGRARISIEAIDGQLRFEVGDDGKGFDTSAPRQGSGLQNIQDRIDALEGTVRIQSGREGTSISGCLPVAADTKISSTAHGLGRARRASSSTR